MPIKPTNAKAEWDSPAIQALTLTTNTPLEVTTRGLYVGGGGDINVIMEGGATAVTFTGVLGGTILPIRIRQLNSGGTSASNILGLF